MGSGGMHFSANARAAFSPLQTCLLAHPSVPKGGDGRGFHSLGGVRGFECQLVLCGARTRARRRIRVLSEAVSLLATETELTMPAPGLAVGAEPRQGVQLSGAVGRDPWAVAFVTATAMGAGRHDLAPATSPATSRDTQQLRGGKMRVPLLERRRTRVFREATVTEVGAGRRRHQLVPVCFRSLCSNHCISQIRTATPSGRYLVVRLQMLSGDSIMKRIDTQPGDSIMSAACMALTSPQSSFTCVVSLFQGSWRPQSLQRSSANFPQRSGSEILLATRSLSRPLNCAFSVNAATDNL